MPNQEAVMPKFLISVEVRQFYTKIFEATDESAAEDAAEAELDSVSDIHALGWTPDDQPLSVDVQPMNTLTIED